MIIRSGGDLPSGTGYNIVSEQYATHTIHYLNFVVNNDLISGESAGNILSVLEQGEYSPLFSLLFASSGSLSDPGHHLFYGAIVSGLNPTILKSEEVGYTSLQIICVSGLNVTALDSEPPVSVRQYEVWGARFIYMNNVIADQEIVERGDQTINSFMKLNTILRRYDTGFKTVRRTWLFARDILDWYDELNRSRSLFFEGERVEGSAIPASTGIGSENILSSDLVLSALAIEESENVKIEMVVSPLQCSALDYLSSFSRAIKITTPESIKLTISGTASISGDGATMYKDDVEMQIDRTLSVIEAILLSNDMSYSDVVRSVAYFPAGKGIESFNRKCNEYGLDHNYIMVVCGTICREDLLFELEIDAVRFSE